MNPLKKIYIKLYERQVRIICSQDTAEFAKKGLAVTDQQLYDVSVKTQVKFGLYFVMVAIAVILYAIIKTIINLL